MFECGDLSVDFGDVIGQLMPDCINLMFVSTITWHVAELLIGHTECIAYVIESTQLMFDILQVRSHGVEVVDVSNCCVKLLLDALQLITLEHMTCDVDNCAIIDDWSHSTRRSIVGTLDGLYLGSQSVLYLSDAIVG